MKTIQVDLGDRSYPIFIGDCLSNTSLICTQIPHKEVVIVSNETVAPLYLEIIQSHFKSSERKVLSIVLPDGEQYKTLDTVNFIFTELLENNVSRKAALIALGGGVIGDMTGFAAASYQRGIDFYQIPTTLLSQVDSSVGGKTGVNHKLGKNMIGAFKQPNAVFIDSSTLTTLPKSEFIAGFAEVIKHGLIFDESYFDYLEKHLEKILSLQPDVIEQVVLRSCEIKSSVVSKDETEQGIRAILNLGHTFGHAIETTMGYGKWLHGEAVGAGMVMAADLSARLGYLTNETVERIRDFITRSGLPSEVPNSMAAEDFMVAMARDKKVDAGKLKFILLKSLGEGFVAEDVPLSELNKTLNVFCKG